MKSAVEAADLGAGCGRHWAGMSVASKSHASFYFSYKNIYRELEQSLKAADAVEDLRWFRANHGPGMSMNWPQFEVGGGCTWDPLGPAGPGPTGRAMHCLSRSNSTLAFALLVRQLLPQLCSKAS